MERVLFSVFVTCYRGGGALESEGTKAHVGSAMPTELSQLQTSTGNLEMEDGPVRRPCRSACVRIAVKRLHTLCDARSCGLGPEKRLSSMVMLADNITGA